MRSINITNEKKRDALVGFEAHAKKNAVRTVLPSGTEKRTIKFLKTTESAASLAKRFGTMTKAAGAIIVGDPEIDIEQCGKILGKTKKMYVNQGGEIAYRVTMIQTIYNADGSEREKRELTKALANISTETPLQWTGRQFPKNEAARKFVFTKNYQLRHTNGLTYDFLYGMAKQLHEADALMLIGAGKKGNEPLVLAAGGEPYRAFLDGRVEGDTYCLVLRLTNIEVKGIVKGGA